MRSLYVISMSSTQSSVQTEVQGPSLAIQGLQDQTGLPETLSLKTNTYLMHLFCELNKLECRVKLTMSVLDNAWTIS